MKYAAQVAYTGANYFGWQRQNNHSERESKTVQQVLEEALSNLNNNKLVKVTGAGRTDQGVHARGQAASFELDKIFEPEKLLLAINFYLPEDIRVMKIFKVENNFDARRSALWREYKYFIYHGRVCPPQLNGFVWWNKRDWDKNLARDACKILVGCHDFKAFCKATECPDNTMRDIDKLKFQIFNNNLTVLTVRAKSFMTNMVRIIAGNINEVAIGKRNLKWLEDLLNGKERASSGQTAPACGLCFWRAGYAPESGVKF
ncbi:MAG: tRNA pseudouridine(38-40) synthase TruA [Synergistaceae bacterium]|nr:tRNA pseudouridine(38-40) synthase TruA [Synergistaceae bacterium]MBQ4419689.1 tRNA pseudouridine(38-40) synthase TruA [Synergistaceae bacterium]MBR0095974.1 tRNA pseudouridine(38-40) synthase TruA [Synergistaceae bacterium]MBR0220398.1 tRNA pseudouridine(38-40) synthase TruA [Synergistaceae bacterium]